MFHVKHSYKTMKFREATRIATIAVLIPLRSGEIELEPVPPCSAGLAAMLRLP
jgi:hypothetical protein